VAVPESNDSGASWGFEEGTPIADERSVLQRLGGGELYDTYLVWDGHRFTVAVAKLLRPDRVEDNSGYSGMQREVDALARLSHPVVVRCFDVAFDGPHPHLLLEHLEGASLYRVVRRQGRLPMEQVLPVALHVAAALHYFAAEGFVHLDVKPENIIMGVPPRLIDLSLVHSLEEARELTARVGTDAFMPPEQCDPTTRGPIGTPADVWGLAATLHFAITASVPYPRPAREDRHTLEDRFPQLADEPLPLTGKAPPELAELIEATLRQPPEQRPTASDFALALQPLVAALPRRFVMSKSGWRAQ
jgi:serine/threonine protein kinase